MQGLAVGIGLLILGWMLAVHRRERRQSKSSSPSAFNFFPFQPRLTAAARLLAGRPLGLAGGGQDGAGLEPRRAVFVGGRPGGQPRIFHQPARARLGHRHRPRPAQSERRRGRDVSVSHGVEPQARPCAVFLRGAGFCIITRWARLDDGCVTRAYAWAGETVWNQGVKTLPEIEAGRETVQLRRTRGDDSGCGNEF